MRLLITRHSKTLWNEERRLQGRKDSKLTAKGIKDAQILGEYLDNEHIDAIYSSPIPRAKITAKTIFPEQKVTYDGRIQEMSFGDYEGENVSKLLKQDDYYNLWHNPRGDMSLPNGETYNQVRTRIGEFFDEIKTRHQNETVFVVTHGMAFIVFLSIIKNLPVEELTKINQEVVRGCSLTEIEINDDSVEIIKIGDSSFLPSDNSISFNK